MIGFGLLLLIGASWTLGRFALHRLPLDQLRAWERAALYGTAGLGLIALALSLLILAGGFHYSTYLLIALSIPAALKAVNEIRDWSWQAIVDRLRSLHDW